MTAVIPATEHHPRIGDLYRCGARTGDPYRCDDADYLAFITDIRPGRVIAETQVDWLWIPSMSNPHSSDRAFMRSSRMRSWLLDDVVEHVTVGRHFCVWTLVSRDWSDR